MGEIPSSAGFDRAELKVDLLKWQKSIDDLAETIDYSLLKAESLYKSSVCGHKKNKTMPEWKLKHATRKGTPTSASLKIKNDKNKLKGLTMASRVKKAGRGSDPKTQASEADRDYKNDNPIDTDAEDIAIGVSQSLDTNNSSEPRSARERKLGKKARLEQQLKKAKLDKLNEKNPKDNNVRLGGENGGRDLQNFAWEKAQKLSIGEKVRDDPALLTKALKKYKGKKEASARKWKVRIEDVQKRMKDRQKKKRQNLEERRKLRRKRGKH